MLIAAAVCFALAGLLGATLLTYVLLGKPTPKALAFTHGPLAAAGLVLLLIALAIGQPVPGLSLGLFVAAALGGLFLIYRDLAHGRVPKAVAVVHGLVAVTALVLLLRAL